MVINYNCRINQIFDCNSDKRNRNTGRISTYKKWDQVNRKCQHKVKYIYDFNPINPLNFRDTTGEESQFEAVSIIEYQGNVSSLGKSDGHYVCDITDRSTQQWFRTNDNKTPILIESGDVSTFAYVILYRRMWNSKLIYCNTLIICVFLLVVLIVALYAFIVVYSICICFTLDQGIAIKSDATHCLHFW